MAGFLCEEINFLPVMVVGSVLTWGGVLASGFTTNIAWISISLGLVHGEQVLYVYFAMSIAKVAGGPCFDVIVL